MLTMLWTCGLLVFCVAWGLAMNTATYGPAPFREAIGVALGMGGLLFVATLPVAIVTYIVTRSARKSMWAWTIAILAGMALAGIGTAQSMRME
jgi:hypothetical protein